MKSRTCLTLALAVGVIALPAIAAERTPLATQPTEAHVAAVRANSLAHQRMTRPSTATDGPAAQPKVMGSQTYPGTPMANAFRAYPPSCAADPLPDKASGQTWSARVPLYTTDQEGQVYDPEVVTVTVWRLACSSSGSTPPYNPSGAHNAITLMRIDRDEQYEHDREVWPTFPSVQVEQGSIGGGDSNSLARVAMEPNTVISDVPFDAPIFDSTTYVLENYPYQGSGYFTYSDAFALRIDPGAGGGDPVKIDVPPYNPTEASYPDAFNPLPLDGYAAAQWTNDEFKESLLVQVTEQYNASGDLTRQIVFDMLTQDDDGNPLWLVGNAAFPPGATGVDADLIYLGNGLSHNPWGKVNIAVRNCDALDVTFTPDANLPAPIPSISGLTTYTRLFDANGMVCE